jgi:hypothetical protein
MVEYVNPGNLDASAYADLELTPVEINQVRVQMVSGSVYMVESVLKCSGVEFAYAKRLTGVCDNGHIFNDLVLRVDEIESIESDEITPVTDGNSEVKAPSDSDLIVYHSVDFERVDVGDLFKMVSVD